MQMPVNNWKAGGFCAENGTAEANAAGRYTGKISLLTLQNPFPLPTMVRKLNEIITICTRSGTGGGRAVRAPILRC